jgi:hypothetical protein
VFHGSFPPDLIFESELNSQKLTPDSFTNNSIWEIINVFSPPFYFGGQKKPSKGFLESPLTHCGCIGIVILLERAARPSGCSEPGTLTRQSLVPGFLTFP